MSYSELKGRTYFVTGAASGMGRQVALLLATQGANVAAIDLRAPEEVAKTIREAGVGKVLPLACNVQSRTEVDDAVKKTVETFGSLHGAANMAGIAKTKKTDVGKFPVETLDDEDWETIIKTNLDGVKNCIRAQLRAIKGPGSIVSASSTGGQYGAPNCSPYIVSKWGVIGLTKSVAKEVGGRGIRVNAVAPGVIDTPLAPPDNPADRDAFLATTALQRIGQPEEVARAVLFLLSDQASFVTASFVQGTGKALSLVNPKDAKNIGFSANSASREQVEEAVSNARKAFTSGPWRSWSGEQRAAAINKLADLMDQNAEAIAYLESISSGRLIAMLVDEVSRTTKALRYFAGWADKLKGDSYPPEDGFYKIVRKEPLGVCVGITAWNASLLFFAWKTGPALATGNTFILKPSEKSFLGTLAVASLFEAAGFPPGVFQVLLGTGEVGSILSSHMDVNKISFTGSTATGQSIQVAAAKSNLKRVTLELGGKSAAIVFEDADIEKALFWVILGITVNSGQVCAASSRLLIQKSIADKFLGALKERLAGMGQILGLDPQDITSQYGPVVDEAQYKRILSYIEEGKKSAELAAGGVEYKKKGYYIAPTLFVNPPEDSKVWNEEIFGPVLCAKTFETEEEAIQIANNSKYGLSGAVFTESITRGLRVSGQVESGTVCVNCNVMVGNQAPMGGKGMSGTGRELGEYGIASYTETKTVWISTIVDNWGLYPSGFNACITSGDNEDEGSDNVITKDSLQ